MKITKDHIFRWVPTLVISAVFLSSLPFKFTGAPETKTIFGLIGEWMTGFSQGLGNWFTAYGAYTVGAAELIASVLLLYGAYKAGNRYLGSGAIMTFFILGGAIFFHLFTPLGIDPNNDGGGLFVMAVVSWILSIFLIVRERKNLCKN